MQLRRLTMGALFNDFLHDLTDLDSRVWRTLITLLLKPGKLTNEFIAGRRTFYLPPFRLYLVLSLVFFLLSFGGPNDLVIERPGGTSTQGKAAVKEATRDLEAELDPGQARASRSGRRAQHPTPHRLSRSQPNPIACRARHACHSRTRYALARVRTARP